MQISKSRAATDIRHRINAPNSTPRSIKLVGIGAGGARLADKVAQQRVRNVDVVASIGNLPASSGTAPGASSSGILQAIAAQSNGIARMLQGANMVFLTTSVGDDVSFAPVISGIARRMGVLVTGSIIRYVITHGAASEP